MLSHLTPRNKPIHLSRMHFLCLKALTPSVNTTLATNTRANSYLSNEPKTHSPLPPPSPPAQQTTQAIHSSISASSLSTSSSAHCSTSPSHAHARPCYIVGRAFVLMSRALQGAFGNVVALNTSKQAYPWSLVVPGRATVTLFLPPRALIH